MEGLAALSLDALSSVAYGPEAIVLVLAAAGLAALGLALPITGAIVVLLVVLVISYRQVIAVHPDGGGSYAVAKANLGRTASLVAAASLVVDYVLTVAVSLAAGAASLASAFPVLTPHLLAVCLVALVLITGINLWGVADSARVLMLPTVLFLSAIFGVVAAGLLRGHPVAEIGTPQPMHATEALGVLLVLKAFSAGCSALTGVEAIANGTPVFRDPQVTRAQHTELILGALLASMLLGLGVLISRDHVAPRGGVTVLAQLAAGSFGTGGLFLATSIVVTLVLGLAANTSFGGLPILLHLLANDNRLPHLFNLRADRPVYRYGVVALAVSAGLLLVAVAGATARLIPLYAIGVFIGFTISQAGLVHHWWTTRPPRWAGRAALNAVGAVMTGTAAAVFVITKFTGGAWVVVIIVPSLMLMFSRIESYYDDVGRRLGLGHLPPPPTRTSGLVIVPVADINRLTQHALSAALGLGDDVVAVSVRPDREAAAAFRERWQRWDPNVRLDCLIDPGRSVVRPILEYVELAESKQPQVTVLIAHVQPHRRRYEILHNQRSLLLAAQLRAHTDAIVATLPYRIGK
jgi:amino acid transporter